MMFDFPESGRKNWFAGIGAAEPNGSFRTRLTVETPGEFSMHFSMPVPAG
jgi:hypothetical protein